MSLRLTTLLLLVLLPAASPCQTDRGTVPSGTPLAVTLVQNYPMRAGEPIRGRLLYPIYADNKLVLRKDTAVAGTVEELLPDHGRRVRAMLGGDFTPFHIPQVHFTQIVLADGTSLALASGVAASGSPIYRAVAPPPSKGGFFHREFDAGLSMARSDLAAFTAPGKGDRLRQFLYNRLPYHPQRIEKGTSWTIETTSALDVPDQPAVVAVVLPPPARKPHFWEERPPVSPLASKNADAWIVQATLADSLSSETSAKGQAIKAVVAEPIYNPDHTVAVPQGATLIGSVTNAKPARRFGRTGVLSFSFNQLALPNAATQTVVTKLTGADSAQNIALNSEGQAKSKPQDKLAIPLFLALMASRPLDQDSGQSVSTVGKNGVGGAAGLGLVGIAVGIAGGSPYAAAGIGYWGAACAVYSRWIAHGQKIEFPRDTRIVVETTPRHSVPMAPNAQPSR